MEFYFLMSLQSYQLDKMCGIYILCLFLYETIGKVCELIWF